MATIDVWNIIVGGAWVAYPIKDVQYFGWIIFFWLYHEFLVIHDDVIKWKHFPRYWPFVRGIHWSSVNFPHKGQWRGALMFSLICSWINDWATNREAGDLRRNRTRYDVTVMSFVGLFNWHWENRMITPMPLNISWKKCVKWSILTHNRT